MKEFYKQSKEAVLQELKTDSKGLSESEVLKRREKFGYNELADTAKKSTILIFLEQFKDFLVIILIIAAIISGFLGDPESAIVIFVVVIVNAILGTVQQVKAENSLNSLKALTSPTAKVIRDGVKKEIPSKEVTVGDIVLLEAGDFVSADGRILENASLKINESALTGESVSAEKEDTDITKECGIGDQINMVFTGCFVTYGRGTYVVTGTGMDTEMGKVASLLKNTSEKKTPLQVNLDNFGRKLSIIILIICAVLFGVSLIRDGNPLDAFMFAVALAVAAIPEALSSIVTIVLSFGTQKMAKENAIIRKLQAVEGLGSVSIICSDKTGTLTQNKMTVKKICISNKIIEPEAIDLNNRLHKNLLTYSLLCSDATNANEGKGPNQEIGDPTEVALLNFADKYGIHANEVRKQIQRMSEVPFDSDRKLMSTTHLIEGKKIMITKGAVDVLMDRIIQIEKEDGILPFTKEDAQSIAQINQDLSENGLRILAFAYKEIDNFEAASEESEYDFTFLGLISMMDPPREESIEAVAQCLSAGIRPIMITGDHKITAAAIAKEIGILQDGYKAVEGSEIDSLSDEELEDFVEQVSVYARVSPEHKIRIVRAWQEKGNIVAMTGDGVNDAPALKQSDIGVAMGITGSEVAKDAASMVLTDDNFATIVKAVENGRNVYANIKNSIKFLLSGNTAGILAVLYASILALPVPFAPVHLLFINLLTDSLPAIALGLEPHRKSVMKDQPRPMNESILTKSFLIDIVIEGAIICITTMTAFYIGLNYGGAAAGSTMAFATLCLGRLVHGFNSKTKKPILFTKVMWNNKYLLGAFAVGFLLLNAVLLIPVLQPVLSVVALPFHLILTIYGLALCNLVIIQLLKWIRTR